MPNVPNAAINDSYGRKFLASNQPGHPSNSIAQPAHNSLNNVNHAG